MAVASRYHDRAGSRRRNHRETRQGCDDGRRSGRLDRRWVNNLQGDIDDLGRGHDHVDENRGADRRPLRIRRDRLVPAAISRRSPGNGIARARGRWNCDPVVPPLPSRRGTTVRRGAQGQRPAEHHHLAGAVCCFSLRSTMPIHARTTFIFVTCSHVQFWLFALVSLG